MGTTFRTHTCGELRAADVGERVTLAGWVHRRRDHGHLAFFDLRDRHGLTQVVTNADDAGDAHAAAEPARNEWVVQVSGVVRARPELRKQLWDNVATLYDGLADQGFKLGPEHGPVVGVHLPDRETAITFWRAMLDAGIYVNVATPPATPNGVSLLRCSLCAVHTREQLEHMIEVMTGIGRQMGVLAPKLRVVGGKR